MDSYLYIDQDIVVPLFLGASRRLDGILLQLQNNGTHSRHVPASLRGLGVEVAQLGDPLPLSARLNGIGLCHKLLLCVPTRDNQSGIRTRAPLLSFLYST